MLVLLVIMSGLLLSGMSLVRRSGLFLVETEVVNEVGWCVVTMKNWSAAVKIIRKKMHVTDCRNVLQLWEMLVT